MIKPLATLSMYEWPETKSALDRFWQLIAKHLHENGITAPANLIRTDKIHTLWNDENLLIGQTCGWPYANLLRSKVTPFARFDYGLPDCSPGNYYSVYIGQEPKDARFLESIDAIQVAEAIAINGADSQSGFHVFAEIIGKPVAEKIPANLQVISGSHRNSVTAVALGKARIAAIDAVSFELSRTYDPASSRKVSVIGKSNPVPGLPLITANKHKEKIPHLFKAISDAVSQLSKADRQTLMIRNVVPANDSDYDVFS